MCATRPWATWDGGGGRKFQSEFPNPGTQEHRDKGKPWGPRTQGAHEPRGTRNPGTQGGPKSENWSEQAPIRREKCTTPLRLITCAPIRNDECYVQGIRFLFQQMHRFLFVTEWHAMEVERILSKPIPIVYEGASLAVHSCGVSDVFLNSKTRIIVK